MSSSCNAGANWKLQNNMSDLDKLEWISFAIQEALNGDTEQLETALGLVEDLREPYLEHRLEGA